MASMLLVYISTSYFTWWTSQGWPLVSWCLHPLVATYLMHIPRIVNNLLVFSSQRWPPIPLFLHPKDGHQSPCFCYIPMATNFLIFPSQGWPPISSYFTPRWSPLILLSCRTDPDGGWVGGGVELCDTAGLLPAKESGKIMHFFSKLFQQQRG
jgi:hypothetical protein